MTRTLIIDPIATSPYDDETLRTRALGGTEATVLRVAGGLARSRPVTVAQSARTRERHGGDHVRYVPWDFKRGLPDRDDVSSVIVVRAHKVLPRVRRQHPDAGLFLWMHCFPGTRRRILGAMACREGCTVVTVSQHHRRVVLEHVTRDDPRVARELRIQTIYNPVDDHLMPDGTACDPDKLVFLSSPHKGLDQVLSAFRAVRASIPSMRLYVANPGYLERALPGDLRQVIPLGKLPHDEVIRHTREALCLFYPQHVFPETFGLVFAEANAVGTPVLTHPLGSAEEVAGTPSEQLVDASDHDAIVERLARWRAGGRPHVRVDPRFRLSSVVGAWEDLLDGAEPRTSRQSAWMMRQTG